MSHDLDVCAHLVRIAHLFTGKEETRYYLRGVRIEPHPHDGVFIVATDGYGMIVMRDRTGHTRRPVTIRLRKNVRKSFPKGGAYRLVATLPPAGTDAEAAQIVWRASDAAMASGATGKETVHAIQPHPEIGDEFYPKWRKVTSKVAAGLDKAEAAVVPSIDPALMLPFLKAQIAIRSAAAIRLPINEGLRIRAFAMAEPTLISFGSADVFGITCSMNVKDHDLPIIADPAAVRLDEPEAAS